MASENGLFPSKDSRASPADSVIDDPRQAGSPAARSERVFVHTYTKLGPAERETVK